MERHWFYSWDISETWIFKKRFLKTKLEAFSKKFKCFVKLENSKSSKWEMIPNSQNVWDL